MTFYRADVQYGVPLYESPSGFYYCSQIWYFNASDSTEYDHAKEGAVRITAESLNVNVALWNLLVREWPSETVVESSVPVWDHPVLSGPFDPPTNTVYVGLLGVDGRQVSYKRVRSPLRHEDYADGVLTDWAFDYYSGVFGLVADYGCFTNVGGEAIASARVRREVASWQLRHGTKRRWRRRIV